MAMSRHWLTVDNFFPAASTMRRYFEKQFESERATHVKRFVWDYWHVPRQYTLLRTPAYHYFPTGVYERWHRAVVNWGREVLGCHDISPPWLSNYVDGCEQHLHADHPHGPWAFVYSLTPWAERRFSGGETFILRPEIMRHWATASGYEFAERDQLLHEIAPKFNRLTIFDPRLPHGVNRIEGEKDPARGRLVLHGWFVQPRPFFKGPLSVSEVDAVLGGAMKRLGQDLIKTPLAGYASVRLGVSRSGQVRTIKWLTDTLVAVDGGAVRPVRSLIQQHLMNLRFSKRRNSSSITLPIRFGL